MAIDYTYSQQGRKFKCGDLVYIRSEQFKAELGTVIALEYESPTGLCYYEVAYGAASYIVAEYLLEKYNG